MKRGLRFLLTRSQRERELRDELAFHLAQEAEDRRASGAPFDEAWYAAKRELGNAGQVMEETRSAWGFTFFETFLQDIRICSRSLRKNLSFTVVAVLTLALGIGANTAIFSVVDAVLLNPLPYPEADRLVMVWEQNPSRSWFRNVVSAANFLDWRADSHAFTQMAAYQDISLDISGAGEPVSARGERVSSDFFSVLGVKATLGRTFVPDEDQPGRSSVVVLSDAFWRARYGADPAVVGSEIIVNRTPCTVVGVLPPDFQFPPWGDNTELWTAGVDLKSPDRVRHAFSSIARLKPGVAMKQAQTEMDAMAKRLEAQHPEQRGWGVEVVSLHEQMVGDTRPALVLLVAAVGMVLLIACANLANLQLIRVAARDKELAVRAALGGGRTRLIRQLLTESVVLAMLGGLLGVLLATWGVSLLIAFGPADSPGLSEARVNSAALIFTLALSIATGIAFGLLPALGAAKTDINAYLRESSRSSTQGIRGNRLRGMLVSAEFAVALILLVGAGLLMKSFVALRQTELGFDPREVLTMRIALLGPNYAQQGKPTEFFRELIRRVESLPGVVSVAAIDGGGLPPSGGSGNAYVIEGRPEPPLSERPDASYRVVSPGYFRTMRIPLLNGRYFMDSDNETAPKVAVINDTVARNHWPGQDPIGSRVAWGGIPKDPRNWLLIVGVVKDVKNRGVGAPAKEEIYVPYDQYPAYFVPRTLVVRASANPTLLTSAIRREVAALDKDQPISAVSTMEERVAQAQAGRRFPTLLIGFFAILALTLAGIGIYGVVSYSVSQRMREVGIRIALGAQNRDVFGRILGQGLRLAALGLLLGIAGALAVMRAMSSVLYGVGPSDPLTFAAVSFTLLAIGLVASYVPARRATRIDPVAVLKYE